MLCGSLLSYNRYKCTMDMDQHAILLNPVGISTELPCHFPVKHVSTYYSNDFRGYSCHHISGHISLRTLKASYKPCFYNMLLNRQCCLSLEMAGMVITLLKFSVLIVTNIIFTNRYILILTKQFYTG